MDKYVSTVCLDFDGVVHQYVSGWKGYDTVLDPPIASTVKAIKKLRENGYRVVICTARSEHLDGHKAVVDWLKKYNIEVDDVCATKPTAMIYIDDRAVTYVPDMDICEVVKSFKPWVKKGYYKEKVMKGEL